MEGLKSNYEAFAFPKWETHNSTMHKTVEFSLGGWSKLVSFLMWKHFQNFLPKAPFCSFSEFCSGWENNNSNKRKKILIPIGLLQLENGFKRAIKRLKMVRYSISIVFIGLYMLIVLGCIRPTGTHTISQWYVLPLLLFCVLSIPDLHLSI